MSFDLKKVGEWFEYMFPSASVVLDGDARKIKYSSEEFNLSIVSSEPLNVGYNDWVQSGSMLQPVWVRDWAITVQVDCYTKTGISPQQGGLKNPQQLAQRVIMQSQGPSARQWIFDNAAYGIFDYSAITNIPKSTDHGIVNRATFDIVFNLKDFVEPENYPTNWIEQVSGSITASSITQDWAAPVLDLSSSVEFDTGTIWFVNESSGTFNFNEDFSETPLVFFEQAPDEPQILWVLTDVNSSSFSLNLSTNWSGSLTYWAYYSTTQDFVLSSALTSSTGFGDLGEPEGTSPSYFLPEEPYAVVSEKRAGLISDDGQIIVPSSLQINTSDILEINWTSNPGNREQMALIFSASGDI